MHMHMPQIVNERSRGIVETTKPFIQKLPCMWYVPFQTVRIPIGAYAQLCTALRVNTEHNILSKDL